MKTKVRLNCYFFSNLIVGLLTLNFLYSGEKTLVEVKKDGGKLEPIYVIAEPIVEKKEEVKEVKEEEEEITTAVSVTKKTLASKKVINYVKPSYNSVTGTNLVNYAKHYLGLPYVSAGRSLESGTDCSGFTRLIYREFGINLGTTVASQLYSGNYVSKSDLEPGDLVFYGYSTKATHVAIYIGGGQIIHESNPRDGVKISSVNIMVYITARRLITKNVAPKEKEVKQEVKEEVKEPSVNTNPSEEVVTPPASEVPKVEEAPKEEVKKEEIKEEVKTPEIEVKEELPKEEVKEEQQEEVKEPSVNINPPEEVVTPSKVEEPKDEEATNEEVKEEVKPEVLAPSQPEVQTQSQPEVQTEVKIPEEAPVVIEENKVTDNSINNIEETQEVLETAK